ncbi:hypothetical protein ACNY68_05550 [Pantoea sp. KXB25]|uniref:hypothetical protein n=1 Tax=unclassified Pantoea TaxID=2630326 RepID=UPI003AB3973D
MKKNTLLFFMFLPAYYVNAQSICVDYKNEAQNEKLYELIIKRSFSSIEHKDIIKVKSFGNKTIQVYDINKDAFKSTNNGYNTKVSFLRNTKIYIDMYSMDKVSLNNCTMIVLGNNKNKTAKLIIDNDITVEIKRD